MITQKLHYLTSELGRLFGWGRLDPDLDAIRRLRFLSCREGVSEFDMIATAYRSVYNSDIHPTHLDGVFKEYLIKGKCPSWLRAFVDARPIEEDLFDQYTKSRH